MQFLLDRLLFKIRLISQELQLRIEFSFFINQELFAVLSLFFKLPVFIEILLLQFGDLFAEALRDLGDVGAGEGLLLPVQLAVGVVDDVAFLKDLAGVLPFGLGVGLREVLGHGADTTAADELRAGIVDVSLALS